MKLNRRELLVSGSGVMAASAFGAVPAFAADGDQYDAAKLRTLNIENYKDWPLGNPDAKVTFIEYLSPTCPHCAVFHLNVLPKIRADYIETDKILFIGRPFVRNVLDAVVFMLASTAVDAQGYDKIIDAYFQTQGVWSVSEKPRDALLDVALSLGFTQESFDAALTNQTLFNAMEQVREQALNDFGLTGTPTFYINGKQLSGEKSIEELAAEIDPQL